MNDVAEIIASITGLALAIHTIAIEWKRELDGKNEKEGENK